MRLLIIGCGSIGERHIRNLQTLSAGEILIHDVDDRRLAYIEEEYRVKACATLDEAWDNQIDACVLCVPPSSHIPLALKGVEHGAHLFIEKPISHNLEDVDTVLEQAKTKGLVISVGYNLRFHPALRLAKQLLDEGRIGKVLSAIVEYGQYLPDWHPRQDYRDMYIAKRRMGGGIILDGSHELDYIRWLIGEVRDVCCFASKISSLEVETEDTAEIVLNFDNGAVAGVHLDFIQRTYSRSCKLIGEEGTIIWDLPEEKVCVSPTESGCWEEIKLKTDYNDTYVEEMRHFLNCIKGEETPIVSGDTAKRVLEIALAAKQSAESHTAISLRERYSEGTGVI
jgi:predicted dehydrogenase